MYFIQLDLVQHGSNAVARLPPPQVLSEVWPKAHRADRVNPLVSLRRHHLLEPNNQRLVFTGIKSCGGAWWHDVYEITLKVFKESFLRVDRCW